MKCIAYPMRFLSAVASVISITICTRTYTPIRRTSISQPFIFNSILKFTPEFRSVTCITISITTLLLIGSMVRCNALCRTRVHQWRWLSVPPCLKLQGVNTTRHGVLMTPKPRCWDTPWGAILVGVAPETDAPCAYVIFTGEWTIGDWSLPVIRDVQILMFHGIMRHVIR